MTTISAFEAKTRFGDLLERVSRGEEIVITKHQKPVARLVPEGRPALSEIRDAVNELASLRREMAKRPGARRLTDQDIRKAIQKGRR
jgi:prevent-host-death family protein